MTISDLSLRVAVLKAVADLVDREYKAARKEAEEAYRDNGIGTVVVSLPSGEEVGSITVTKPSPSVAVDDVALLAWVEAHNDTEVEEHLDSAALTDQELIEWARAHRDDLLKRRVRPVWRAELVKQATGAGGFVVDVVTGESAQVAEVTEVKRSGAFTLRPDKAGAALIIKALRGRELDALPGLAIAAAAEDGA